MGHAVGREFRASGLEVLTCLSGRSPRTCRMAELAGFKTVPSLEALAEQSELILSILVPEAAAALAQEVARALTNTGCRPVFADCNAVSPATTKWIGSIISEAGGRYLDASIIGPPPGQGQPPRFYVSGSHAQAMAQLDGRGIAVRWIGNEVGRASAIKMCYAGLTKGTLALHAAVLTSAEAPGSLGRTEGGACLQPGPEAQGHGAGQEGAGQGLPLDRRKWRRLPAPSAASASRRTSTPGRPRSSEWWRRATWEGSGRIRWTETARSRRPYPNWPEA